MNWSVVRAVPPVNPPITLAEAKSHLRVDYSNDDTLIQRMVLQAASELEGPDGSIGRSLITQTLRLRMDEFPGSNDKAIRLPLPPLISVASIAYVGTDGVTVEVTPTGSPAVLVDYDVLVDREPGELRLKYGKTWPPARDIHEAVTITYTAGYGALASNIPEAIRDYMFLRLGEMYENREAVAVGTSVSRFPHVANMLDRYLVSYPGPVEGD